MSDAPRLKRNDRRDVDRAELKLMRVGHAIWAMYKAERGKTGVPLSQYGYFLETCETVWELKRQVRAELAAKRKAAFAERRPFESRP